MSQRYGRGEGRGGGRGEGRGGGRGEGRGGSRGEGRGGGRGEGRGGGRGEGRGGGRGEGRGGGRGEGRGGGRGEGRGGGRGEGRGGPVTWSQMAGGGDGRGESRGGGRGDGRGGPVTWSQMAGGGDGRGESRGEDRKEGSGEGRKGTRLHGPGKKQDQPGSTGTSVTSEMELAKEESLSKSSLLELVPERKNKQGRKEGIPMQVEANFFPITLKRPNVTAYQYDVVIEPKLPKYMIRIAWNEFVNRNFPGKYPSFDGSKIAISASSLTDKSLSDAFEVNNPENNKLKEYRVEIKLANILNLQNLFDFIQSRNGKLTVPMAELAALDIILRNHAANTLVRAGRNLFQKPRGNIISLGDGMEVWQGYYQSAVLGWKIYLNFDVSHRGFPQSDILKTVEEICFRMQPLTRNSTISEPRDLMKLENHLKSLKVEYEIPQCKGSKRVFKVNGVRRNPADSEIFKLENNVETNVVKYYREVKNYEVKYPKLPCLWVGSTKNTIYVPMELCTVIPGQVKSGKLNEFQTSNMIKYAAAKPKERKQKIMSEFSHASFSNQYVNEFGISVAGEFEKIEARILNPPQLESGMIMKVHGGRWDLNRFLDAKPLAKWCVLILDDRCFTLEKKFVGEIMRQASAMGMQVEIPIPHRIKYDKSLKPQFLRNSFIELKQLGVALAFVIIPDKGDIYAKVKRESEIEVGVLTQCIRRSTLNKTLCGERINRSTFSNILLKVNAKLNGVNHSLHSNSRPKCLQSVTMIVGADVTHPPPDAQSAPSIAAVAASHDTKATQYNTIRKVQPSKLEVIQDFQEIMKDQLMYFYRKTGLKPEKIVVFRDGVSEGQVDIVLREELRAIQQACISLQAGNNKMDYQPQITFLIVQKRHHTRFFPVAQGNFKESPTSPNVPAGTCVDSVIVHPRDLDFYLVSHMSRLGTARPTKYKLIYDDSDMTEDELEKLSYYLCHLVVRCSMSISYPAPTYYAHLAALRGRAHLSAIKLPTDGVAEGQRHIQVQNHFKEEAPMFFV